MESYRDEIRTPPLALVALLGRPDLQPVLSDFLLKEHRPPLAAYVMNCLLCLRSSFAVGNGNFENSGAEVAWHLSKVVC